jgi:hypothetical protein
MGVSCDPAPDSFIRPDVSLRFVKPPVNNGAGPTGGAVRYCDISMPVVGECLTGTRQ